MLESRINVYASATVAAVAAVVVAVSTRPPAGAGPIYTAGSYFAVLIFAGVVAMTLFFATAAVLGRRDR